MDLDTSALVPSPSENSNLSFFEPITTGDINFDTCIRALTNCNPNWDLYFRGQQTQTQVYRNILEGGDEEEVDRARASEKVRNLERVQ